MGEKAEHIVAFLTLRFIVDLLVCFPTCCEPLKSSKSKCLVHFVVGNFIVLFLFFSAMSDTQRVCNKCLNEQMKTLC